MRYLPCLYATVPCVHRSGPPVDGRAPDRKWVPFREDVGWIQVMNVISILAGQYCDGVMLRPKGTSPNCQHLKYKYYCGY
jgi:hypothetical protein